MLRDYSCLLWFPAATPELAARIDALGRRHGLPDAFSRGRPGESGPDWAIEFDFVGRDNTRRCVRYLLELAGSIADAEGEAICSWFDEETGGDERFEFHRIAGGKLIYQPGRIQRGDERVVELDADALWDPSESYPDRADGP